MKPLLTLLACLLPLAASAQKPPAPSAPASVPGSPVADPAPAKAPRPYYKVARKAAWEGDAIGRVALVVPDEISVDGAFGLCMVPPAADWVLDSKDPTLEEKYLRLLAVASALDAQLGGRSINGGQWIGSTCLEVTRYAPTSYPATLSASYDKWCPYDGGWAKPGVSARFAYTRDGNRISGRGPWWTVVDSVKALLESEHEATVLKALDAAKEYALPASSPFAPTVAKLVLDSKRSAAVRKKAMSTLAGLDQSLLTAKTLAAIWQDSKNSAELRIAAMNAFGFVVQYHDSSDHLSKSGDKPYAPQFLPELKTLIQTNMAEKDDFDNQQKKEPQATNTPLGSAAYCVGSVFPKTLRDQVMGRAPGK